VLAIGGTGLAQRIARIIAPTLTAMGFDLVRVQIAGQQRKTLQIMAEPESGREMTVDDCAAISRALSALLDVEDPIGGAYNLEVSSPGIDRPLTRAKDFQRFAGHEARLETLEPVDGSKRFRGIILGLEGDTIRLRQDGADLALALANVQKAKLVLTDALIAAHRQDEKMESRG